MFNVVLKNCCAIITSTIITTSIAYAQNKTTQMSSVQMSTKSSELSCLTEVIYFEARGESYAGRRAVAHVVLNRKKSRRFPNSICGVVGQRNSRGCQFSYRCDGRPEVYREGKARTRALALAKKVLNGDPDLTKGALYFHTRKSRPSWSRRFRRTTTIGNHHFYKP